VGYTTDVADRGISVGRLNHCLQWYKFV